MLYFLGTILLVIFIVPIIVTRIKTKDNFHPVIISSFLNIITIVPYIFIVAIDETQFSRDVVSHSSFESIEKSFFNFTMLQILAYLSMLVGLSVKKEFPIIRRLPIINNKLSDKKIKLLIIPAIGISMLSYFIFLQQIGGISYLLNNLNLRASFTSGNGYLLSLMKLMTLSVLVLIYKYWNKKGYVFKTFITMMLLLNIFMESSMGGRKSTIFIVIFVMIVIHYSVKKIKFLKPRFLLLIGAVFIYFILVPFLRADGGVEKFLDDPSEAFNEITEDYTYTIRGLSYVSHYILIINHFNNSDFWLGLSYLDLIYAPIPSAIFYDKPPVDDGVYVRSIAEGMNVEPNTSRQYLYKSSWPPETFGAMYMNFGIMGLIIGFMFIGFIYKQLYILMKKSNFSFIYIYIYSYIIMNFELSNLRIVQTLSAVSIFLIFYSLLTIKSKKNRF